LAHTNEACHVLVEYLKPPAVFFWLAWVSEATWSVQDFLEGVEVDYHCAKHQY
jgi:hypothetical protein